MLLLPRIKSLQATMLRSKIFQVIFVPLFSPVRNLLLHKGYPETHCLFFYIIVYMLLYRSFLLLFFFPRLFVCDKSDTIATLFLVALKSVYCSSYGNKCSYMSTLLATERRPCAGWATSQQYLHKIALLCCSFHLLPSLHLYAKKVFFTKLSPSALCGSFSCQKYMRY